MSILKLKHSEIDKVKWDELVHASPNSRVYSLFGYLNAVSPGFEALILEKESKYQAAFPFPIKKKFGIKYLVQPLLVQQLEVLNRQTVLDVEFKEKLIKELKSYPSVRVSLVEESLDLIVEKSDFQIEERKTLVIDLQTEKDYRESFSKNHKRNIKKSGKIDWDVDVNTNFEAFIDRFLSVKGSDLELKGNFRNTFLKFIPVLKDQTSSIVINAMDTSKNPIAGALLVPFNNTVTFLMSYSDEKAKKYGLMHALIDYWLQNLSGEYKLLDFEGGNIEALERFYSGFGAKSLPYGLIKRHKFPFNVFMG